MAITKPSQTQSVPSKLSEIIQVIREFDTILPDLPSSNFTILGHTFEFPTREHFPTKVDVDPAAAGTQSALIELEKSVRQINSTSDALLEKTIAHAKELQRALNIVRSLVKAVQSSYGTEAAAIVTAQQRKDVMPLHAKLMRLENDLRSILKTTPVLDNQGQGGTGGAAAGNENSSISIIPSISWYESS